MSPERLASTSRLVQPWESTPKKPEVRLLDSPDGIRILILDPSVPKCQVCQPQNRCMKSMLVLTLSQTPDSKVYTGSPKQTRIAKRPHAQNPLILNPKPKALNP